MIPSLQCSSNATQSYLQGCLSVQSSSPWHKYEAHMSQGHSHCLRGYEQTHNKHKKY